MKKLVLTLAVMFVLASCAGAAKDSDSNKSKKAEAPKTEQVEEAAAKVEEGAAKVEEAAAKAEEVAKDAAAKVEEVTK